MQRVIIVVCGLLTCAVNAQAQNLLKCPGFEDLDGATAGTEYDRLSVTGTVVLGSATLDLDWSDHAYDATDKIFIVVNDGADAISGTFNGLAQDATINFTYKSVYSASAKISYTGDSDAGTETGGNDVVLYDFWYEPVSGTLFNLK